MMRLQIPLLALVGPWCTEGYSSSLIRPLGGSIGARSLPPRHLATADDKRPSMRRWAARSARNRALRRGDNDPRGEVLGSLFATKRAELEGRDTLQTVLPDWLSRSPLNGFTRKKETILRWRVAQQRALVDKAAREIEALSRRSKVIEDTQTVEALSARITSLRREAGVAESP